MGRVKSVKDLPEGVLEFASTPEGDIVYGKELESDRKQQRAKDAKEELAKTDTLGSKAKAVGEDVVKGIAKVTPGYGLLRPFVNREFGAATKEHNEKVKKLKETVDMKKGGIVSSASKRADGCAVRGKTKGRMV
jgi:hypothetical protein